MLISWCQVDATSGTTHCNSSVHIRAARWLTDSSSDSASHTHSDRRPSAAALLTHSRGGGLTTPLAHSHTQTHTLSYGIAMGVYSLSLSLSLCLPVNVCAEFSSNL